MSVDRVPAEWPEVDVSVRFGWLAPRWIALSEHPDAGIVRGWGLSRAGALRSVSRRVRRHRAQEARSGAAAG